MGFLIRVGLPGEKEPRRNAKGAYLRATSLTSLQQRLVKAGGWLAPEARPVLLAAVGPEPSDAAAVRSRTAAD